MFSKYLQGALVGLCLAGALNCASSKVYRNEKNYQEIYKDYNIIKFVDKDSVLTREEFYGVLDRMTSIERINLKLTLIAESHKRTIIQPEIKSFKKDSTLAQITDCY